MGASSHDNTIVLRDIVINPANDYQLAFYVASTGFVIKQPTGRVLYQGKTAADQFHYISFSTFDELKPVESILSSRLVRQIDMHDLISDVVDELDSEDKRLHDEQSCIRITLIELIYPYMNIPTLTIIYNETVVSSPLKSHKTIINRTTY